MRRKENILKSQWELKPNARENAGDQVIGWERGASFLDQPKSKVTQNQCNPRLLSKLNWKLLCRQKQFLSIQNCETEFSAKISYTCVLTSTWCSPFVSTRVLVENKLRSAKEFKDYFSVSARIVLSIKLYSHSQLEFCVFFFLFFRLTRQTTSEKKACS